MNAEKRKTLEALGYKIYDHAGDAVGMTEEEKHLMDLRLAFVKMVRAQRQKRGISQKELAVLLGTSQPRVAKIEGGDYDVSLDQIVRAFAVMGGRVAVKELRANSAAHQTTSRKKKAKPHVKRVKVAGMR